MKPEFPAMPNPDPPAEKELAPLMGWMATDHKGRRFYAPSKQESEKMRHDYNNPQRRK